MFVCCVSMGFRDFVMVPYNLCPLKNTIFWLSLMQSIVNIFIMFFSHVRSKYMYNVHVFLFVYDNMCINNKNVI